MKRCSKCKEFKFISEFSKNNQTKDKLQSSCKKCASAKWKNYYNKKKNVLNFKRQKKYWENVEEERRKLRERSASPHGRKISKEWRAKNPEKEKAQRKKYKSKQSYKDRHNQQRRQKYKEDRSYNIQVRISGAIKRMLRESKQFISWNNIINFSVQDLTNHIEHHFKKGMSWDDYYEGKIVLDHYIPIKAFEFSDFKDESFQLCWQLDNIYPEWDIQNISKSDKLPNGFQARSLIYKIKDKYDYDRVKQGGLPFTPWEREIYNLPR